jgi:phytoene desaturase
MARIIVIGGGFGGLAAAIRLAARGHEVTLFEKQDIPGGRAYVYKKDGFTFDCGPTVITVPQMFDDIWQAAGKQREDYFEMRPVDPFYRIFNHEGRHFDYNDDEAFILDEIARWNPGDRDGYRRFMQTTQPIFQKGFVELADKPFLKFTDMVKIAPALVRLQAYLSVYRYVARFVKNEFLRRCFTFHPLLIGGNPFDTSAIYAMIHYIEREWGVRYAVGGTGAIIAAMGRLFEEIGGELRLNAEVGEILVEGGRAVGVRLVDGTEHRADYVVSNADVAFTYRHLIPERHRRKYTNRRLAAMKYSMSLVVIFFGTTRRYDDTNLVHHNIILSERYKELLRDIFKKKRLADDFSLSPEGCEAFYALSPVPHLDSGIDWTTAGKPYRDAIMQFLEDNYLPGLQANIAMEHYITPLYYEQELNSYKGAGFSLQPILLQSAWFRPHNKSEDVGNLYFAGAGTHPGAGLPGVLSSAIIVEDLITETAG